MKVQEDAIVDCQAKDEADEKVLGLHAKSGTGWMKPASAALLVPLEHAVIGGEELIHKELKELLFHTALVDGWLVLEDDLQRLQERSDRLRCQGVERILHEMGAAHTEDEVRRSSIRKRTVTYAYAVHVLTVSLSSMSC